MNAQILNLIKEKKGTLPRGAASGIAARSLLSQPIADAVPVQAIGPSGGETSSTLAAAGNLPLTPNATSAVEVENSDSMPEVQDIPESSRKRNHKNKGKGKGKGKSKHKHRSSWEKDSHSLRSSKRPRIGDSERARKERRQQEEEEREQRFLLQVAEMERLLNEA